MFVRCVSDLHIEFANYEIEPLPEDKETILCLPGDIGLFKHKAFEEWLRAACSRFHTVLHVAGNHEYYGSSFTNGVSKFQAKMSDVPNFHLLNRDTFIFQDVLFVGATLWTNFNNGNPIAMMDAEAKMSDYRQIRIGPSTKPYMRKIRPTDIMYDHIRSKDYIQQVLEDNQETYRATIVMTHHGPSRQSIAYCFKDSGLNDAYVSNLDDMILEYQPTYFFHGHIHSSMDYKIGETRVVANPKGYPYHACMRGGPEHENSLFNPTLRFEI